MAKQLKITVLKKGFYRELADEYAADKSLTACPVFEEGQAFILDSIDKPEGFCSWAWADLNTCIVSVFFGADFSGIMNQKNTVISCCTDGLRPVVFKIESIG